MVGLCVLVAIHPAAAWAALGKELAPSPTQATPATPAVKRLANAAPPSADRYTRQERTLENGTTVWEYATPGGVVFAVQWRGPVLPDLSVLLGNYFQTFVAETETARRLARHGSPVNIERNDVVIRSHGRMRNFFGHAYAPDLLPAGVMIADVLQ